MLWKNIIVTMEFKFSKFIYFVLCNPKMWGCYLRASPMQWLSAIKFGSTWYIKRDRQNIKVWMFEVHLQRCCELTNFCYMCLLLHQFLFLITPRLGKLPTWLSIRPSENRGSISQLQLHIRFEGHFDCCIGDIFYDHETMNLMWQSNFHQLTVALEML